MSEERWRWVDGYEGLYMVSDQGRVMSVPKKNHYGHIMKQNSIWSGYMRVCLCKGSVKKYYSVHRLVAEAFIKNKEHKPEVNHKNGDRSDNRAENLEWVTRSENETHAFRELSKRPNKPWAGKPRKFARKFTDEQIRTIRADERPLRVIGDEHGVSKTTIRNIKNRKNYMEVI